MTATASIDALAARFGAGNVGAVRVDAWGGAELARIEPETVDGLREVVRFAASDGKVLVPTGLGSKLGWTAPPTRVDALLSTRRLAGVLDHEPADGTLSARAGTSMQELAEAVRAGGHRLTPDVPAPAKATLGGTLAAGASGADRLRFGPARHHVLGARVLLGDGTLARSGGQLVKNVTGFDLHRLYTGSHGTLCVIVEAALRLLAGPEHEVHVATTVASAERALELARTARALAPLVVALTLARSEAERPEPRWLLSAHVFGKREAVDHELAGLVAAWPRSRVLAGEEARAEAAHLRDRGFEGERRPWLRANLRPSRVGAALERLEARLAEAGSQARIHCQPGIAVLDVQLGADERPGVAATWIAAWRRDLEALDARAHLREAGPELAERAPHWHGEPAGLERMRALQARLDPGGVFARGRLAGGL